MVYVLNFAALGYVVAWALLCGSRSGRALPRLAHGALRWIFTLRFLRFIGKHSLQVYAYHVALVYGVLILDGRYGPLPETSKAALTLLGIASLAVPAWLHARHQQRAATARARPASA